MGSNGARVLARTQPLTGSLPRTMRDIDTAIQMLKDDLDACAPRMKRLIEVNSRGALFEGWAADI